MTNILPVSTFEPYLPDMMALLKNLMEIESPSTDKEAVDRLGAYLIPLLGETGGAVEVLPRAEVGDLIISRWGSGEDGILLLSHIDTVYGLGTLARQPVREADDRRYGPGGLDMKASIAMLVTIARILRAQAAWPARPLTALFTTDEEIGSQHSRSVIEDLARRAGVVFCLEPALANGAVKTARKGTGDIHIIAHGVSAHAGVDHEKGRNAIEELAYHVLAAQKLTDYSRGTTVNVGVIRGGTRGNVVPETAEALIDFRASASDEIERLRGWTANLSPVVPGTRIQAEFELNRPPMPRNMRMAETFGQAKAIAGALGLDLREGSTGGGSDANFVAPLGVPVLDGLGAVGDGAHSEREYVLIPSLVERAALLAALLLNW